MLSEGKPLITYDELKISVSDTVLNLKFKKETTDHTHVDHSKMQHYHTDF